MGNSSQGKQSILKVPEKVQMIELICEYQSCALNVVIINDLILFYYLQITKFSEFHSCGKVFPRSCLGFCGFTLKLCLLGGREDRN